MFIQNSFFFDPEHEDYPILFFLKWSFKKALQSSIDGINYFFNIIILKNSDHCIFLFNVFH